MSKERELLQRCLDEFEYKGVACNELCIDINKLLAQPEQKPVAWMQDSIELYVLEEKSAIRGYVIPLYTAPPTREPPMTQREAYQRGYAEAKLKLKREPLSTKQAEDLWETTFKSAVPYYIFDEICGAIEQYHGIGADDE